MSELEAVLEKLEKGQVLPLYLCLGEEFLARKSAEEILHKLVPDAAAGLNLIILDGGSPKELAQELATLPLFPGRKAVLVRDPEFLAPKKGRTQPLAKALDAWRAGRRKEAARRVLAIAARAGWGADQLDPKAPGAPSVDAWREELNIELADADLAFLSEVAAFCQEERITAPESDVGPLVDLIDRGLPEGHALVIAATDFDAKNPLYKLAGSKGARLERKVSTGEPRFGGKAKKAEQEEAFAGLVRELLAPLGKKLGPGADKVLVERIGGNVRLLQSELEKLAAYAEGNEVRKEDVELLVAHAREEQFFELTNALQARDLGAALRYVEGAIAQEIHPLQLLGMVASGVRGLLEARERVAVLANGRFPRSPKEFERTIYPHIEAEALAAGKKPPHPFAAFKRAEEVGKFSRRELFDSLRACADADLALKSGASKPAEGKQVIERLLWTVCGHGAPAKA